MHLEIQYFYNRTTMAKVRSNRNMSVFLTLCRFLRLLTSDLLTGKELLTSKELTKTDI